MDKAYYREMWEEAREELKIVEEENKDLISKISYLREEIERLKQELNQKTHTNE